MKTSVIAATIAGGVVLGTAAFVPFGGHPLLAAEVQTPAADEKIVAPPADEIQEQIAVDPGSQSSESTNPNAGTAGTDPATGGSTSGGNYSFGNGGDDDDEGDDGDHEDREDHEDDHEDEEDD